MDRRASRFKNNIRSRSPHAGSNQVSKLHDRRSRTKSINTNITYSNDNLGGTGTASKDLLSNKQVDNTEKGLNATRDDSGAPADTRDVTDVFKEFIKIMKSESTNVRPSVRYPVASSAVPEFDPNNNNQTIDMWITKVNECASIYNWSEPETLHYALPKLIGVAQRWYQSLPTMKFTWEEWQVKLKTAFPSTENYGIILTEMLNLRVKFGDSLENYFYEKMILLHRCRLSGKDAVDCILLGIDDRSVRTGAEAVQFTEPDKLLVYLRSVKSIKRPEKSVPRASAPDQGARQKTLLRSNREGKVLKCYNCGEDGHPSFKCKQPLKKCDQCFKLGHLTANCPFKTSSSLQNSSATASTEKSVKVVCNNNNNNQVENKYYKTAVIDKKPFLCYIDFGSQCTMMQWSAASNILTWDVNDLPVLRGFGNGTVKPLGKCTSKITIDTVTAEVQILIVPDQYLTVPLLVGQTFTEQSHIAIIKTNEALHITTRSLELGKVLVYTKEDIRVNGLCTVEVYTVPKYTGDIAIEHQLRQEPRKEYEIFRDYCRVEDGKGFITLRGFPSREFVLPMNTLLIRSSPANIINVNFTKTVCNNNDNSPKTDIYVEDILVDKDLDSNYLEKLVVLLNEFRKCFAFSTSEIGCTTFGNMEIQLKDSIPVVYRPYRLSHTERETVREIVNDLETNGIIKESSSEYASPIILVKKKTGEHRMCVDFRALNKKTVKEHYPMPRIEDQIDSLAGFQYYTTLDLASGYYQIPMSEHSKPLTAFVTPDGHYEFNRMPFGLANAPSTFQRIINKILGRSRFKNAFAYMDDIVIPSMDIESGLEDLRGIMSLFKEAGLTLKISKCHFFKKNIDYLGFDISSEGVKPGARKIVAVQNFPRPVDQHSVRQFIGLSSFFRRFVKDFSLIARPLTQLLRKDSKWEWGESQENAFVTLRKALVERPVLSFYNPTYETQLHTDASKHGLGGILLQREKSDYPFKAVAYYSRQTSPEEQHFTSYDLETLAVVCSLQRFRVYLLGLHFKIITDCNSLRATLGKRDMIPRVARWWNIMQEYDFEMEYRPGNNMQHVDALSRNPVCPPAPLVESDVVVCEVREITVDWLTTVQKNDSEIQRTMQILNDVTLNNIPDIKNNYVIKRGLLYRKTDDGDRWVVPKGVRWQILKSSHDDIGHFAFDKTLQKVKNNYWWPKMNRFIKKYVQSCLECAHSKGQGGKKAGELHPIPKIDCPFHTLHFDHLGPFIKSKKKHSYLLVIIDAFTKFIVLVPVKNTKASTSIKVLQNYFDLFSVPKRVISDRGSGFTAKRFQSFLATLGVKHVLNAVATPRANGQVERYNRTILGALTAANHGKAENLWDETVSKVQWGLNNTINQGTGKTPSQVLFGLQLTSMGEARLRSCIDNSDNDQEPDLETVRTEVSNYVQKNQEKQKKRFDRHRKTVKFQLGDLVRVEREIPATGRSRKLIPRFQGPYRITQILDHDRYEIRDTPLSRKNNRPFKSIVSVDKILPWLVFNRDSDDDDVTQSE